MRRTLLVVLACAAMDTTRRYLPSIMIEDENC